MFEPEVSVRLGSLDVDASRVDVDRELPDPFMGGGFAAATGTVAATVGADVADRVPTPWDPSTAWPPVPEAFARIRTDMGDGSVQSLTGRVSAVSGGTSGREVTVEVADRYQTLDRPVSFRALGSRMPHPSPGQGTRYVGLNTLSITDMILRRCGWYATPPLLGHVALSVPANGTMWPEVGNLETSGSYLSDNIFPIFWRVPWGLGVTQVDATYGMQPAIHSVKSRGRMEMAAMTNFISADRNWTYLSAQAANGEFRLEWTPNSVRVLATNSAGNLFTAANIARSDGLAYAQIEYVTDSSVRVTLQSGSVSQSATVSVRSSIVTGPIVTAAIKGDHLGGGFQVAFPSQGGTLTGWTPTVRMRRRDSSHLIDVWPPMQNVNCADLLREQCEAEAATFWIDEQGVLQWWHLDELDKQTNTATLTADDHIGEGGFSWSHDLSAVKSSVSVEWKNVSVSVWSEFMFDLWQGSGQSLDPGQTVEDFITAPNDEVWIVPDLSFRRVGVEGDSMTDFNLGRGSFHGGVVRGGSAWAQTEANLTINIQRVTDSAFKYSITWGGTTGVELKTPNDVSNIAISQNRRSFSLPILRGKSKYKAVDETYTAAQAGPSTAPELSIAGGWWIQRQSQAQAVADYVASRVTVPQPVLSAVDVVMWPGVQLGDVVTIREDAVSHLTIRGLVVGDSRSMGDGFSHSLTVRPITVTRDGVTWAEWGEFMQGSAWNTWGSSQAGKTWTQWGNDPLAS